MKRFRSLAVLSLTIVGFLLLGAAAKADIISLTLNLASPYQIGLGPVFEFDGTLTNTGGSSVFLNGDFLLGDTDLTLDDSPFNTNAPLSLDSGDSYTGLLFTVTAPPYGPGSNFYAGSFSIIGGGDNQTFDLLASENFNVQVTPEPSSYLLFGTGLAWLAGTIRRRRERIKSQ